MKTWNVTKMPTEAFEGLKVFVLGGAFYANCVSLFAEAGFERADSVEEADVVAFIGGVDVNPALYGEKAVLETQQPNEARDTLEKTVFEYCRLTDKPMFGICRGAQFLHVMNGGKLWQDVNNHAGRDHTIYDVDGDLTLTVTSIHHQMLIDNDDLEVIAVCNEQIATTFKNDSMTMCVEKNSHGGDSYDEMEIEAGAYPKTKCFFVQGHPEVGSTEFRTWTFHKFKDFLECLEEEPAGDPLDEEMREQALDDLLPEMTVYG